MSKSKKKIKNSRFGLHELARNVAEDAEVSGLGLSREQVDAVVEASVRQMTVALARGHEGQYYRYMSLTIGQPRHTRDYMMKLNRATGKSERISVTPITYRKVGVLLSREVEAEAKANGFTLR